jgi:hypothetical protein
MSEDKIHYLIQHIINLRQILAVNCRNSGHAELSNTSRLGEYRSCKLPFTTWT